MVWNTKSLQSMSREKNRSPDGWPTQVTGSDSTIKLVVQSGTEGRSCSEDQTCRVFGVCFCFETFDTDFGVGIECVGAEKQCTQAEWGGGHSTSRIWVELIVPIIRNMPILSALRIFLAPPLQLGRNRPGGKAGQERKFLSFWILVAKSSLTHFEAIYLP